jgi:hypothetical protein
LKVLPNVIEIQFKLTSKRQFGSCFGTSGRDYRSISIIVAGGVAQMGPDSMGPTSMLS